MLVAYGEKVGVAFQLADDVIDLTRRPVRTGKTPGTDLREGVPTMPVLLARRAAADGDTDAAEIVALVDGDLSDDAVLAETVERLRGHSATEITRALAQQWADDAVASLDGLPDGEVRSALAQFAGTVADRTA